MRAVGHAKARTASTIISGSRTAMIASCRQGGWAARGFRMADLRIKNDRSLISGLSLLHSIRTCQDERSFCL